MKRRLVKKNTYFKRFINAYSECGDTCTNRQTCGLIWGEWMEKKQLKKKVKKVYWFLNAYGESGRDCTNINTCGLI